MRPRWFQIARDLRARQQFIDAARFGEAIVGSEDQRWRELHLNSLAEQMAQMRGCMVQRLDDLRVFLGVDRRTKRSAEDGRLFQVGRHPHFADRQR
ncbi:MAG: hypothetical protein U5J99_13030 [Parvularculaceae bacterium]|nr:hypothetical protein [Parvularculaceae bacterium]